MTATDSPEKENISLLDEGTKKGCCRIYGPDSAWSWLVAFANFLVNFIIVGLGRMSGILYVEFMHIFNIDRTTASIPFSIQQAGRNLFGPAAGILGQKYGIRPVTILGGAIGSLSSAIIFYKMDIMSTTVLWGLFFGLSTALTTTLNQISIDQYFEKHRATAGGFAFSGGCLGAFCFPIVIETLIDNYSMRGTFLIIGAIILFVLPAAMLLGQPPWKEEQSKMHQNITRYGAMEVSEPSTSDSSTERTKINNRIEAAESRILQTGVDFKILQQNSDMVFQFLTMDVWDRSAKPKTNQSQSHTLNKERLLTELECVYASAQKSFDNELSGGLSFSSEEESRHEIPKVHYRTNGSEDFKTGNDSQTRLLDYDVPRRVYIQAKLNELYEAKGLQLVSHFTYSDQPRAWKILLELRKLYEIMNDKPYFQTMYENAKRFRSGKRKGSAKSGKYIETKVHSNTFCSHFKTAIKLHSNPLFLLICLCRGVFMLTFIPVVTIIVDFSMDKGLPRTDGKYVIAVLSLGDLIGRLCLGWITDRGCLSLPRYMLVGMVILGGSTASLPFMTSKPSFMAAVLLFGILQGSLFVRHPLLVTQYMEKHEQAIGMGFINFFSGFLGFALPAFIGFFRDKLGSYDKMFYLNGIICATVGLIWIMEPLFLAILAACKDRHDKTGKAISRT